MNQDGNPIERKKLLWLRPGHACAQPGRGKNGKYLHNSWSIHRPTVHIRTARSAALAGRYHPLVRTPQHPGLPMDAALLKPGLRLAVGLSGGADSVALLCALAERSRELGLVLHAAHLHHGLRGAEADADLAFCRDLAAQLGLAIS